MNGTYNQMPAQIPSNNSNYTRSLVTKIGSSIIAALISIMMFLPCITFNSFNDSYNSSLMDVYKGCFLYFSERNSYSRSYNSYFAVADGLIIFFFILITLVILCSISVLILSLVRYSKVARIFALLSSICHTLVAFIILILILISISVSSLAGANATIGWGLILQILLSITEIIFTAIAISCNPSKTAILYQPPVAQLQPQPPVGVVPNPQLRTPINQPASNSGYDKTISSEQSYPNDDGQTIAQFGVIEGLHGDYYSAVINIMPGEIVSIGRDSKSCNIVISSEKVSRKHCTVEYDALNRCYIVIDSSSNGTIINHSQPMQKNVQTRLQPGTELSIGNEDNVFRLN